MLIRMTKPAATALALSLGLVLAGCGGQATNRSLYSTKQPVVERNNFALDLAAGPAGVQISEQQRLNAWFEAMDLGYGDRVSIDDPTLNPATRAAVEAVAARYGLLVSDGAPVTVGALKAGTARVVVTRSMASVEGCPDWDGGIRMNYNNATADGYGCAINSNLAAMVADPEHLVNGAEGTGETVIMTSTKAIDSYREKAPSGEAGLKQNSTGGK